MEPAVGCQTLRLKSLAHARGRVARVPVLPVAMPTSPSAAALVSGTRNRTVVRTSKSFAAKRFRYVVELGGTAILMAVFLIVALLG